MIFWINDWCEMKINGVLILVRGHKFLGLIISSFGGNAEYAIEKWFNVKW